jgi:hypothetical protein
MLRLDEWNMEPTGFNGSGRANEVLKEEVRLGIMIGSSSEDDSSPEPFQDCEPSDERLLMEFALFSYIECAASARARPLESMVNRIEALDMPRDADSGIEVSPESRCRFSGETLPEALVLGLPVSIPEPDLVCEGGLATAV